MSQKCENKLFIDASCFLCGLPKNHPGDHFCKDVFLHSNPKNTRNMQVTLSWSRAELDDEPLTQKEATLRSILQKALEVLES